MLLPTSEAQLSLWTKAMPTDFKRKSARWRAEWGGHGPVHVVGSAVCRVFIGSVAKMLRNSSTGRAANFAPSALRSS